MLRALRTYWRVLTCPWGDVDGLRARHEAALGDYERDVRLAGELMGSAADRYLATERLLRDEARDALSELLEARRGGELLEEELEDEVSGLRAFLAGLDRQGETDDGLAR